MYLYDTFINFLSGLGIPGRDKMSAHEYTKVVWTRHQLEASFQTDWIARKAISIPAQDATREWRSWQARPDQIEQIEEVEAKLQVQMKLQQALVKARLYGGCCLLIGVDGNFSTELIPETIRKDSLKYIHVLAPHQLHIDELDQDLASPYYGQPKTYRVQDSTNKVGDVVIHPSRMVRLIGLDPPDQIQNSGWGDPLMQVIHDSVSAAGAVMGSIATMISEAKIDVIKVPGLTEIFSTSEGTTRMIKRMSEANVAKSVINAVLIDGEEEWQRISCNFMGMPEVLQMYLQVAAGAADIPVTRFLGQSPAGLNSTGESDLQNYYDRVASDQELRLTPALEKLDKVLVRSALGTDDPNIFYNWNSLWQMDDGAKADIQKKKAEAAKIDAESGLIPLEALSKGRCNQLVEDGTYPGLEAAVEEALLNQELGLALEPPEEQQEPPPPEDPDAKKGNGLVPAKPTIQ